MIKRVIALLLSILMCILIIGCQENSADKSKNDNNATSDSANVSDDKHENTSTPVLYKVSDGKNTVWLFGSIHIGNKDYYPLPSYVMQAYKSSDALAVEFDLIEFEKDYQMQAQSLLQLMYTDGTKISGKVDASTYTQAVEILKENKVYSDMYDYYMPSLWSNLIDSCLYQKLELDLENGIDKHFLTVAKKDKKEILEVESAQAQYKMLATFSPELQEVLLSESIEKYNSPEEFEENLLLLQKAWIDGDEKEIEKMASMENEIAANKDLMTEKELELVYEYVDAMLTERNESMTQYAVDTLKSGKEVFICVGAAHIIGDGAMALNLKELGYTVQRVE